MSRERTAIDLFSGCGGLSYGLKRAGFSVIGAVEMDSLAASTFRMNFPEALVLEEDIEKVAPDEFRKQLGLKKGELTLLAGCPPCQGFSPLRANRRPSSVATEPMNDLIFRVQDFVKAFEPQAIMIENVPRLAKDRRIEEFQKYLEGQGYSCNFDVHDAQNYGIPQRRRRMIFMALKGKHKPTFAKESKKVKTVREAIKHFEKPNLKKVKDPLHDYQVEYKASTVEMIKHIPKDGGSRTALPEHLQLRCHKGQAGFKDVYGRMAWDAPAPTITCGCVSPSKGRFLHPTQDRGITMREAATLQGFPKSFKFDTTEGIYLVGRMIGNAFPPKFATKHAKELAKQL